MDSLSVKLTPGRVREALQNLPSEIEHTYDQAMQRIEATNEEERMTVMNFLLWMTFSAEPLTVGEVEHASAIAFGADDIEVEEIVAASDLTSMCAGLVIIDASGIVRFVHFSAKSYFQDNRERLFGNGDWILAQKCLKYMSFRAFATGPCLEPTEIEDFRQRSMDYPLLGYSCCYYGLHASQIQKPADSTLLTELFLKFLSSKSHLETVIQALWFSDNPDVADWDVKSGAYPLHLAAYYGLASVISNLVREGGSVDCRDSLGTTPLMYATSGGHANAVRILLRERANPNLVCKRSSSTLHRAIMGDHVDIARMLLDRPDIDLAVIDTARDDQTPLMLAASLQRSQIVPIIIQKNGLDINVQSGPSRSTALTLAARYGDAQTVRQLLAHPDIDVNKKDQWCTPLTIAAWFGYYSVVEALLDHGADTEIQEGTNKASGTPLKRAIDEGHTTVVQLLMQRGANPKVLDIFDRTIIHSAAVNGQDEVLRIIFEKPRGIDVNAQGTNGRTALHNAAYHDFCSTIEILFTNGARTDIHDKAGNSPLRLAREVNNLSALSLLAELRKREQVRDYTGGHDLIQTSSSIDTTNVSFLTAAKLGMIDIIKATVTDARMDHTIDINTVDLDRHSALHHAVKSNHINVLSTLISAHDININTTDRLKHSPLH